MSTVVAILFGCRDIFQQLAFIILKCEMEIACRIDWFCARGGPAAAATPSRFKFVLLKFPNDSAVEYSQNFPSTPLTTHKKT